MSLSIPMTPVKLPKSDLSKAIRLMGFDFGEHLFHVLCFDFGDDGGALGIWREGDNFCARISLDSLAEFWHAAKTRGPDAVDPGRALCLASLNVLSALMDGDPAPDTRQGKALTMLSAAIETYERATLPPPFGTAPTGEQP